MPNFLRVLSWGKGGGGIGNEKANALQRLIKYEKPHRDYSSVDPIPIVSQPKKRLLKEVTCNVAFHVRGTGMAFENRLKILQPRRRFFFAPLEKKHNLHYQNKLSRCCYLVLVVIESCLGQNTQRYCQVSLATGIVNKTFARCKKKGRYYAFASFYRYIQVHYMQERVNKRCFPNDYLWCSVSGSLKVVPLPFWCLLYQLLPAIDRTLLA